MYSDVVMGMDKEILEHLLETQKRGERESGWIPT